MATWGVSSWLVVVRCLQVLGILTSAILNGFLLVYIHLKRLGLTSVMLSLEVITCVTLIYTAIVLLVLHTGRRRHASSDAIITTFVVGDILFTGLTIGLLTMMARTGIPSNCAGMTRSDFESGDADYAPEAGYETIRFGSGDDRGMLDRFCSLERGYYFITVAIILSYMATVTLGVLRILEGLYTRNDIVNERLNTATELVRLEYKVGRTPSGLEASDDGSSEPLTATVPDTTSGQIPTEELYRDQPLQQQRRPQSQQQQHAYQNQQPTSPTQRQQYPLTTLPVSPLTPTATAYSPSAIPASLRSEGLLLGDLNQGRSSVEIEADDAMITDGYRGPGSHTHSQGRSDMEMEAEDAMITDGYRGPGSHHAHHHHHHHAGASSSSSSSSSLGASRMSDPDSGSLAVPPPYTPGESSRFMDGHAHESNDMRLSEYVKGQTRAQDMKDSDGFS